MAEDVWCFIFREKKMSSALWKNQKKRPCPATGQGRIVLNPRYWNYADFLLVDLGCGDGDFEFYTV